MRLFCGMAALVFLSTENVLAHEVPIRANDLHLHVEQNRLIARFTASAPWWIADVFQDDVPPPTAWPTRLATAAKTYFDNHCQIQADGQPLPSEWMSQRYTEEVWQLEGGAHVILEFGYRLPPQAKTLSGQLTFYREDQPQPGERVLPGLEREFMTRLHVEGRQPRVLTIPLEAPNFTLAITEIQPTRLQRWRREILRAAQAWAERPWMAFLLMALHFWAYTRRMSAGRRWTFVGCFFVVLYGAALPPESFGFALGFAGAFVLGLALIEFAVSLYRKSLRHHSEMLAERLWLTQCRFVTTGCALIGAYGWLKGWLPK